MFRSARCLIAYCGTLVIGGAAQAHHGFGTFDSTADLMTLEGAVTDVQFINPHSWVYFTVTDQDGNADNWRCEMRAATVLRRSGWTPEMFEIGETITITGPPERNQLHVVERFSLDVESMALTRAYWAEDPLYFVGRHTGSDTLYVADAPFEVHPCQELMNVDYSVDGQN